MMNYRYLKMARCRHCYGIIPVSELMDIISKLAIIADCKKHVQSLARPFSQTYQKNRLS